VTCTSRFGFSARCELDTGHTGNHRCFSIAWTDTEAATSRENIAKTINKGRTD